MQERSRQDQAGLKLHRGRAQPLALARAEAVLAPRFSPRAQRDGRAGAAAGRQGEPAAIMQKFDDGMPIVQAVCAKNALGLPSRPRASWRFTT